MKTLNSKFLVIIFLLISINKAHAEKLNLVTPASLQFKPVRGITFYLSESGEWKTLKTEIVSSDSKWIALSKVEMSCDRDLLKFFTVFEGDLGEILKSPETEVSCKEPGIYRDSKEEIQKNLNDKRKILKTLDEQLKNQQANIDRLQTDADIVANVSKIVSEESNLTIAASDLERLEKNNEFLSTQLDSFSHEDSPRNFEYREEQLVSNLKELASVAKGIEAGEKAKQREEEQNAQAKLRIIEETRYLNRDNLMSELEGLKRQKEGIVKGKS